ncbi:toxic anion resistance protein [Serratia rubidaea]|nr:toxic anion resistance protein [Serratia rubidaea]MBS0972908.1 toxic anion resistance protein [Serratia rubidaea]MDC6108900.1 toxic anion resistance protein [Serratia rubidaea]QPR65854.1 toxic anion resistance protein [Serratia rubidaea]UJD82232.1 toxic anion resistance protein [Serratia rubidaea]UJD86796.1 toxic anion resistance protein [Serratia rubidaea]
MTTQTGSPVSAVSPTDLPQLADEQLTLQEQDEVQRLVEQIDITDPVLSIAYAAKTMNSISRFSEALMQEVRAKDAGAIGEQLTDLLGKVKAVDLSAFGEKKSLLASLPLLGRLFNKIERTMAEYQTLAQQVDNISKKLEQTMVELLRNIATLEQLFTHNREFFQQINLHIIAGKQKLALIQNGELRLAQEKAAHSSDAMDAQYVRDLMEGVQRFERRLHDLMMSRTIAVQTAPQIRLMQSNSQSLAEKIQSSILTTIPVWKSQIVLALSLNSQRQAAKLQKDVADTTNDMLRRNAELLQTGTLETAREVERSLVDVETLRDVQGRLLSTIEDTVTIASEARVRRAEVEKELAGMEQELRSRLAAIAANQRPAANA